MAGQEQPTSAELRDKDHMYSQGQEEFGPEERRTCFRHFLPTGQGAVNVLEF